MNPERALAAEHQVALVSQSPLAEHWELHAGRKPEVCVVAQLGVKKASRDPDGGQSPYLVRPDRAGGDLLNGQGLLQLGAERGAVMPAAARPGPPATWNEGRVTRAQPGATFGSSGKSVSHLQSHARGKQRPQTSAAMASAGSPGGVAARGRKPRPRCREGGRGSGWAPRAGCGRNRALGRPTRRAPGFSREPELLRPPAGVLEEAAGEERK